MDKKEIANTIRTELNARGLTREVTNRILYNNNPQNKQSQINTDGIFLNLVIKT